MFFEDHEKRIYTPPDSDRAYDPLNLRHTLMVLTSGGYYELLTMRNAPAADEWGSPESLEAGDVSADGKRRKRVEAAAAEIELAKAARVAFDLPAFPDCTDAQALEWLYDFVGWMEKKGDRGEASSSSDGTSPPSSTVYSEHTTAT